ncbi:MAG: stimulus-sensing domain-containing protein [Hyphomicrobiaceae bacterium]
MALETDLETEQRRTTHVEGAPRTFVRAWHEAGLRLGSGLSVLRDIVARGHSLAAPVTNGAFKLGQTQSERREAASSRRTINTYAGAFGAAIRKLATRSVLNRLIVSNVITLAILFFGYAIVSSQNKWLIDAKLSALDVQSQLMAVAVASNAHIEGLPDRDRRLFDTTGDIILNADAYSALDFTIQPERVLPTLLRLIEGTNTRVRIYGQDGAEIIDSDNFLTSGGMISHTARGDENQLAKPKTWYTRLLRWQLASPLQVYEDRDGLHGHSFREVRATLNDGAARSMILVSSDKEQMAATVTPVVRNGQVYGALMLSTAPGEIDELLTSERLKVLLLGLLAGAAMIAGAYFLNHTVAGPVRRLSAAAEAVSLDINAHEQLKAIQDRTDEIGQLSRSFEKMTTALLKRIEASERFAADVAHELKNPLAAARATAETLEYARTDEQRDELVAQIGVELKRLDRLITDISNAQRLDAQLARQETVEVVLADVAQGVVSVFSDLLSFDERKISIELIMKVDRQRTIVRGHEDRLGQVLTNLIDNAISFSPKGGGVSVTIGEAEFDQVEILVDDCGPGIDSEQLELIFKRFYTWRPTATSSRGNNSGLGLSITREIVIAHGGTIVAENRPEGGARFRIHIPHHLQTEPRQRRAHWAPARARVSDAQAD